LLDLNPSEIITGMNKTTLTILVSFLLLNTSTFASIQHRSGTEIMHEDTYALELQNQTFTRTSSYDQSGVTLPQDAGETFVVNDWILKYTKGLDSKLEASFFTNYRGVNYNSTLTNANNYGFEKIGFEGKDVFTVSNNYKMAIGIHFHKSLYTSIRAQNLATPLVDQQALGDDGFGYGLDYFATYFSSHNLKYDFKLGYNKPSNNLSSELPYNSEAIYSFKKLFLLTGFGGIISLKNDPYTGSPTLKPASSSGNSRLFNSINREKQYLYAGAQYTMGNCMLGIKGESVVSGKYTDKGNTISISLRWEDNEVLENTPVPKIVEATPDRIQDYFAEGIVTKVATSGNMIRINIGADRRIAVGIRVDIFHLTDYANEHPLATGTVIEVGPQWAFVKLDNTANRATLHVDYPVRVY
jgi:hypothetical protein